MKPILTYDKLLGAHTAFHQVDTHRKQREDIHLAVAGRVGIETTGRSKIVFI